MSREGGLYGLGHPGHNGLLAAEEAPLPRANSNSASTTYSNAGSVNSTGIDKNLTPFEEILSYIEVYTEKPDADENSSFHLNVPKKREPDIAEITATLSDKALTIFEKYGDRRMNTAIGYLKEVRDKLSGGGGKVLKHLKYIRKMLAYILYRALPDFIKPPSEDEGAGAGAGAGSKGGYRRRQTKKVKRSRRRLTHRR